MANANLAISNTANTTIANLVNTTTQIVETTSSRNWTPLLQSLKIATVGTDVHDETYFVKPVKVYKNANKPYQVDKYGNPIALVAGHANNVRALQGKQAEDMFYTYTATGTYKIEIGNERNNPLAIQFSCLVGSGSGTLSIQRSWSLDGINFTKTGISAVSVAANSTEIITLVDQPLGAIHLFEVTVTGTTEYYAVLKG